MTNDTKMTPRFFAGICLGISAGCFMDTLVHKGGGIEQGIAASFLMLTYFLDRATL